MGIIEAIKLITFEEAFEKGFVIGTKIGIEIGWQYKTYEVTKNLLFHTDFEIPKIAALANCSESFVKQVQNDLEY
ncbi:hypothetical protein [Dyadobacter frigoris]|uniref:Uncharacterized protein n=1 Tax=Dyadobacter frigoris TaxID=2576211 RepID=A0A4U6D931_9BACT|nr:hypothetical protein [Dyadobacter frigoris]TKT94010.1 hypothetical protein FDK13_02025 [Dyadobacter frigoris]GLU50767.1 hypothetical protein Dfri01_02280 [Dyadobacter frigoris]